MARAKKQSSLNIKIRRGDRIVTRALDSGERLTIGQDPENDLPLVGSTYPKRHILFDRRNGAFCVRLQDYMDGEVRAGESVLALSDLITHNILPRDKNDYVLNIPTGRTGYLTIGDARIEFEVAAQRAARPDRFAFSMTHVFVKRLLLDVPFKVVFLVLLVMQVAFSQFVDRYTLKPHAPMSQQKASRRIAKFIVKQPPPSPTVKASTPEAGAGKGAAKKKDSKSRNAKRRRGSGRKGGGRPRPAAQGILGLIGGVGESQSSSQLVDFLVDKGLVKELDSALGPSSLKIGKGSGAGNGLDDLMNLGVGEGIDDFLGDFEEGAPSVDLGGKGQVPLQRMGQVTGSSEAVGNRTEESLLRVVRRNQRRIEYIYNKYLKQDPTLRGKILIEITIASTGRVIDVTVKESTVGIQRFLDEIVDTVRRWRFDPIKEGSVKVNYPLVFMKTG